MRIVLVEDESKTRNGIMNIIQRFTSHEVVATAEDGQQGYEVILRERPDLVICDICMPVMSGLDMLQRLYDEKVQIHAIMLTGHSDFAYAQKALRLQVVDYLLKPMDVEEFLRTLSDIETRIGNSKIHEISAEQLIVSYLEGTPEDNARIYPLLCEMLHVSSNTDLSLFLLAPRRVFAHRMQELMKCVRELMVSLVIENAFVVQVPGAKQFLVIVSGTEKNRTLKSRFEMRVLPELSDFGSCTCVYDQIHGLEPLTDALQRMEGWLPYAFSLSDQHIIDAETVSGIHYETIEYPESIENAMIRELRNGHLDQLAEHGRRIIDLITEPDMSPDLIREYAIRLIANVFYVARDMKEYFSQEEAVHYYMEMILQAETLGDVRYQLEKFVHTLTESSTEDAPTENGLVMNAIACIRLHYTEDIGLTEIARMCGVSPEYLSRLFYRETGINFSTFLQNFRVNAAKRLLLSGDQKVYEVAEAVGFNDQKYFVKVFKKLCGVTPSEFRKEGRR